MTEYRLISSDSHVTMPDDAWQDYLSPEFRDRAPRIEHTDDGDFRVFEGTRTPIMTLDNLAGKKPEEFTLNVRKLDEQRSGRGGPGRAHQGHGHSTASTPRSSTSAARCRPPTTRCASTACAATTAGCPTSRRMRPTACSAWLRSRSTRPNARSEEIGLRGRAAGTRQRLHPAVPARG